MEPPNFTPRPLPGRICGSNAAIIEVLTGPSVAIHSFSELGRPLAQNDFLQDAEVTVDRDDDIGLVSRVYEKDLWGAN